MTGVTVQAAGMITAVGLDWPSSCAAIRCNIDNFTETGFLIDGDWQIGAQVALDGSGRGLSKLVKMAAGALDEALERAAPIDPRAVPLFLCVAERERRGRLPGIDNALFARIEEEVGARFDDRSRIILQGRTGGATALKLARRAFAEADPPERIAIVGVDSYLVGPTLTALAAQDRLMSAENSNGFIPGEAAAALILTPAQAAGLRCTGLGFAQEPAPRGSGKPLRAEGLAQAVKAALAEAGLSMAEMDYRLCDAGGDQYGFKDAALALSRTLHVVKERFEFEHLAPSLGEIGAATVPAMLAVTLAAQQKGYAPGPRLIAHAAQAGGARAALVLDYSGKDGG
ncbi:MAG: hypothetical protein ACFB22_09790 [Rhodothalassiaceae bacterium]